MYRINIYPEYVEKRRVAKERVGRSALVTVVVVLEVILVISLVITGSLLREQAAGLQAEVERLSQQAEQASGQRPEIEAAFQMLEIRQARIDWSPKLASLSHQIDRSLRLTEVAGQTEAKGRPTGMELTGVIRGGGADMQSVSRFMDELRSDRRVGADFPFIKLGNLEGGGSTRFQIICGRDKGSS